MGNFLYVWSSEGYVMPLHDRYIFLEEAKILFIHVFDLGIGHLQDLKMVSVILSEAYHVKFLL